MYRILDILSQMLLHVSCVLSSFQKTIETTFPPLIPWETWLRKRLANWTQCSGHEGAFQFFDTSRVNTSFSALDTPL